METRGGREERVTSVAEQYPCLVPLNPSSGTGAKALCQDVTTRDSTTQPPMGHHYPDLAAHSGYDSISYAFSRLYALSFVQLSFICAEKGERAWSGQRIDTFERATTTSPLSFHAPFCSRFVSLS